MDKGEGEGGGGAGAEGERQIVERGKSNDNHKEGLYEYGDS